MAAATHVMYIILRRDLLKEPLSWPIGAVATQAAHAATAALWTWREDAETTAYMADMDHMHKVTLGVDSEAELLAARDRLTAKEILHRVWVEDDMPVAIALKPYTKDAVKAALRPYKLF